MIFLERGRELIAAQFVGIVVIKNGTYMSVDTLCYSRHIHLRLSARVSHEAKRRSGGNLLRSTQYAISRVVIRFIKIS